MKPLLTTGGPVSELQEGGPEAEVADSLAGTLGGVENEHCASACSSLKSWYSTAETSSLVWTHLFSLSHSKSWLLFLPVLADNPREYPLPAPSLKAKPHLAARASAGPGSQHRPLSVLPAPSPTSPAAEQSARH